MKARGLADEASSRPFLEPKLTHLHDPSLVPDLDRAAERVLSAVRSGEPIVIYGDYDVDGVTATAILWHMIRAVRPDADVRTYVPHRLEEGYGLNTTAVEQLARDGARVIVTVDCGVTAIEPALAAKQAGVDLIITDHHNPPARLEDLPEAFAVVHPQRPDSAYPFEHLSGAGVAFKLAWRIATLAEGTDRASAGHRTLLVDLLALAALGAIADVVPLTGENRVIARYGLGRVRGSPIPGLAALVEAARLDGEKVSTWDVGFRLAPRLNATGRMAHAAQAVELFTTAAGERAWEIAEGLEKANVERRAVEKTIFEQACEAAEKAGMTGPDRRAIVLADDRWHKGVVGIVCSRLVERYARPAILMHRAEGVCSGSGRSIDGFNMHAALQRCEAMLERYGGHDMAAGMSVRAERFADFVEAFTDQANAGIAPENLVHRLSIDACVGVDEITHAWVKQLGMLEPFGRGNPPVSVVVRGASIEGQPQPLGQGGAHLAFALRQGSGRGMRVVAWRWGEHRTRLCHGMKVDAVLRPGLNEYNGTSSVQGELEDLREAD